MSSPLQSVAKLLFSSGKSAWMQSHFVKSYHTTSLLLGGRYTTQEPDRVKHWRQHLSKKAKKRISRSSELTKKREGAAAGNVLASIRRQELNQRSLLGSSSSSSSSSSVGGPLVAFSNPNDLSLSSLNANTFSSPSSSSSSLSVLTSNKQRGRLRNQELSPVQIANLSRKNQIVIETALMSESPPVREIDVLRRVDIDALSKTLRNTSATDFNKRSWIDLIRACGAQGKFSLAVAAFSDMRVAAAAAEASSSKSDKVDNSVNEDDVYAYTALLHSCGLERNIDAAKEVYLSMVEDGVTPTHVTIGALIQAHVRAFDINGASAVLKAALKDGVKPTPLLFTPIIVGHVHNGEHEEAWEVFHTMREFHCEPDVVTYTTMISSCAKRDMVEKAMNLFDELRKNGHQATHVTYSTMLHASARSMRLYHHAFSLFHEMGTVAGLSHDVRSFNAVLLACSQQGDVVRAREYMADMIKQNVKPDSITAATLLTVYARALKNVRFMGVPRGAAASALSATGMRGVNATVSKSPSSTNGAAAPAVYDFNTRNASGLETLDKEGLLTPSTRLIQKRVLEKLPQARLIEGSTNDVVEGLLRDYYVGPQASGGDGSVEEESLLDSLSHRGVDRDKALQEKYLPPLKDISLNIESDEYRSFRDALLASGVVDKDLIEDIEEEHGRMPSLNPSVEAARAEKFEKRHIARMKKLEEEALALAKSEVMGIPDERSESAASSSTSSSSSLSSSSSISSSAAATEATSSSSLSSKMLLDSIEKGEKLSLEEYLVALEKEVMTGIYGTQVEEEQPNDNKMGKRGLDNPKQQKWESIFSSPDSVIGGVSLRDLLDESTVKLPPPTKEDIELGGTGAIEDALRNPIEVDKYIRSAIEKRVKEALDREAASTTATVTATAAAAESMTESQTQFLNSSMAIESNNSESSADTSIDSSLTVPSSSSSTTSSSFSSPPALSDAKMKKKRGFAARVLSRLMEPASAGKLESLLVLATDDDSVALKRQSSSSFAPGLADVLLSVQKLKARVDSGSLFSSIEKVQAGKETTLLQDEAVLGVAKWINKRGSSGSVRLRGLINLSDGTFGAGSHWLTSLEAYPSDTASRKKALVEEVKALLFQEFPKMGVKIDLPLMNAALSCLCNAGESKEAYDLISTHYPKLSLSPDTKTFRPLIRMHVAKGETSRAEASLTAMGELGLTPDAECFGLVVHAQAKDWRVRDAIETVRVMRDRYNIELPEFYASLLRRRCKEMGIIHPLVPEHPIGWMYSERIMQKKKADSVETRKQVRQSVRHVLKSGMR
jgi:pentatricopeptide repeat protein